MYHIIYIYIIRKSIIRTAVLYRTVLKNKIKNKYHKNYDTRVLYSIHGVPGTVPGTGYGYSTGYPVLGSS